MRTTLLCALTTVILLSASWPAGAEDAIPVSLCELLADPAAYNHKLVEISGRVSRGFEDFTLSDEVCHGGNPIWLEMGGAKGAEVMYCCDVPMDPERPAPPGHPAPAPPAMTLGSCSPWLHVQRSI